MSPHRVAFKYNMSLQEFFDRGQMQRRRISWKKFVTEGQPKYPFVLRTKLKTGTGRGVA